MLNKQEVIFHVHYLVTVVTKRPIQECTYQMPDKSCKLDCRLLDLQKIEHEKKSGSSKSLTTQNELQLIRQRSTVGSTKTHGLLYSQVEGTQNWLNQKQPECKHTTVSIWA